MSTIVFLLTHYSPKLQFFHDHIKLIAKNSYPTIFGYALSDFITLKASIIDRPENSYNLKENSTKSEGGSFGDEDFSNILCYSN